MPIPPLPKPPTGEPTPQPVRGVSLKPRDSLVEVRRVLIPVIRFRRVRGLLDPNPEDMAPEEYMAEVDLIFDLNLAALEQRIQLIPGVELVEDELELGFEDPRGDIWGDDGD
jgi:hypothetical protein